MKFSTYIFFRKMSFALLILPFSAFGQSNLDSRLSDPDGVYRDHQADITKMVLNVRFEPNEGRVFGSVTHSFKTLRPLVDSLEFDAPGIVVNEVVLNNKIKIRFKSGTRYLVCYFDEPLTWDRIYDLSISYEAKPRKGLYFIGWNSPERIDPANQSRKQIWTQGQGIDNRHWIPMYDDMNDKFITETIVTFNEDYKVLSNGLLKSEKRNEDSTITWHYAMSKPHAGYLLMLAVDRYAVKQSKTSRGVPVSFWYYPEHPERVHWTSRYTEEIIDFLEDETGVSYPWESYSQVMVQDFMYGAMENTTATIFGDFFWVDSIAYNDRYYVGVNAHELTHQWFGDFITARSSADVWLQESWATYYAKLFEASLFGEDHLKWAQRQEVERALEASQKDHFPVRHSKGGTSRVYSKGSTVIQMLRYVLGDAAFKRVIRSYLSKNAYLNVESNDLQQTIQDELGLNLSWFFDQWIYKGSEPSYQISYDQSETQTTLHVKQVQQTDLVIGFFKMPLKCRVHYSNGRFDELTAWTDGAYTRIDIPKKSGKEIAFVLFDVNSEITKSVVFEKSTRELLNQFSKAEHMIDRYDALYALRGKANSEVNNALMLSYAKEQFWAIKGEILKQLIDAGEQTWVINALQSERDVQIIKHVLLQQNDATGIWRETWERALKAPSYILRERALNNLCKVYPNEQQKYLDLMKSELGHNHNIRIKGLELSAQYNSPHVYVTELLRLSSDLYEFRTRVAAFNALKNLNVYNQELIAHLLDAAISTNGRLAGPAREIIRYFNQTEINKKMYQEVYTNFVSDPEKQKLAEEKGLSIK